MKRRNRQKSINRSGHKDRRKAGHTLVEIVIVMSITVLLMAGVLSFYIHFYMIGFVNEQRNLINRDMRQLTAELGHVGRQSNDFFIYNSIAKSDRSGAGDRRLEGTSGDLLVFTYNSDSSQKITERIVCYFRDPESSDSGSTGPVRRFEIEFKPASALPIEMLIPDEASLANSDLVVELSKGLADGRLFYNFRGRSVMLNGQIFHGNNAKRVTETYNFTISPRG